MKMSFYIIVLHLAISLNCIAQDPFISLDSLESSFERIPGQTKIPCEFAMVLDRKVNGKLIFMNKDSTQLELDCFKIKSLPFFDSKQIVFDANSSYLTWVSARKDILKNLKVTKIEANQNYGYWIFKIADTFGEFYQLLAKEDDVLLSIKIFDRKMSVEEQLSKLTILYELNKKWD